MSLLLDALKKADRERHQQGQVAGIDADYHTATMPTGVTKKWLWISLAIIFLLILVVLWLLLKPLVPGSTPASQVPLSSVPETLAVSGAAQKTLVPSAIEELPEAGVVTEVTLPKSINSDAHTASPGTSSAQPEIQMSSYGNVTMVGEPWQDDGQMSAHSTESQPLVTLQGEDGAATQKIDEKSEQTVKTPRADTPEENVKSPGVSPEIAALYRQPDVGSEQIESDAERLTDKRNADTVVHEDGFLNAQVIRDLPLAVQNSLPTLMYSAHGFNKNGQSSVVINGRMWRQGQQIAPGITVEGIYEQGVVLQAEGQLFRLKALSSWVNM